MSRPIIRGEISEKRYHYHQIEWTIKNIFSYTQVNKYSFSPPFSFLDAEWRLKLYPYGETIKDSKGWMDLYLVREKASTSPRSVNYSFGIKKWDGTVETVNSEICHVFVKKGRHLGYPKWFKRSDLLARRYELAPSDNLTITCNIRATGSLETASGLNKIEYLDTIPVISEDHYSIPLNPKSVDSSPVGTASYEDTPSITGLQELSDDFKNMFLSRKGCDTILKVRKEEFHVHRLILASRSPVFEAMFEADMKEKNTGVVDVVDCHPKAFKDFLVFIYTGKFENSSGEIFELYSIAHKYDVERLKSECVAFMMENLTAENVVDGYAIGHRFDEGELKEKSQDFFNENVAEIISNDKWDSLLKEKLTLVNMLLKGMAEYNKNKYKDEK